MKAILAASAIAAALLLPLAAHPSPDIRVPVTHSELKPVNRSSGNPWTEKPVFVPRDPFLVPQSGQRIPLATAPAGSQGQPVFTLPVTVRAIASGENSRALVDIGGVTRIVGVGDIVGSLKVTSIGAGRIQLSNGSIVTLEGADVP